MSRPFVLNPEQQFLFDKIVSKAFDKVLVLGEGGVGKSVCICKAVSELTRGGFFNLVVCAPTHLARLNIVKKVDNDVRHLVQTCTVASLLMKFGVDTDEGTVQFTAGKLDKINKYDMVVLDECSMISDQDYQLLMDSKAKIIFSGDLKQLPPVMAKSAEESMTNHISSDQLEVVHLKQQMRQQGVIHAAAERNRNSVWFPSQDEVGEGGESITVHDNNESLIRTMVKYMTGDKQGYAGACHNHRYITYRNRDVRGVGKRVRDSVINHYFGFDPSTVPFVKGEMIMMRENRGTIGYNGELVEVKSFTKDSNYVHSPYAWDSYEVRVSGSIGEGMIRAIPPCQYKLFDDHISDLQSKLHSYNIRKEVDEAQRILKEIKKLRTYWTAVQYPYAVSTHKSQGMTIPSVYLDTKGFVTAPNRRALLYVGISRASDALHTIRVGETEALDRREVNERYRKAREQFEFMTGESYRAVLRRVKIPTGTVQGKDIMAGYLESLVMDMAQGVSND